MESLEVDFGINLAALAKARLPLYRRWFPNSVKDVESALPLLIRQGAEYSLMADVIASKFPNPFIVGADHVKMGQFYKIGNDIPVLYIRRNYE